MNELPLPRDVSALVGWLRQCTPGTLIPAPELLERVEALPIGARPDVETNHEEPEQLLTAEQVAEWLQMNVQSVYRLSREGNLPRYRTSGNTVRFERREVERWLKRRAS